MAYFDGTNHVLERVDYVLWGKTNAENGQATQVSSVPAGFQASYTEGFNLGTHTKKYTEVLVP